MKRSSVSVRDLLVLLTLTAGIAAAAHYVVRSNGWTDQSKGITAAFFAIAVSLWTMWIRLRRN